jgi:hypothetical protein
MKLHLAKNEIESDAISEKMFDIADAGFIISVLRDKIYSNKIKAVVQEYICNARDAHRANGTKRKFIVSNPTILDPNWRCRDFGDSITPENMENIFIRYGASTKRKSNKFTGGFGFGCKSGFCYGTGTFSVITYLDGIKRTYNCFIDDSNRGKLALLEEIETNEPNGLEIVVPVEKKDFDKFVYETFRTIQFWPDEERPEVCEKVKVLLEESKSDICLEDNEYLIARCDNSVNVIIDGISYQIPIERCSEKYCIAGTNKELPVTKFLFYRFGVFVKFPIGVLPINISRESIELTKQTQNLLQKKMKEVENSIISKIHNEIATSNSIDEAYEKYNKYSTFLFIKDLNFTWNGYKVYGNEIYIGNVGSVTRFLLHHPNGKPEIVQRSKNYNYYKFDNLVPRVIVSYKDIYRITKNQIKSTLLKLMESNNLCCVDFIVNDNNSDDQLKYFKSYNFFDYYTVPKNKMSNNKQIGNIFYFENPSYFYMFKRTSLKKYKEAPASQKKFWCFITKNEQLRKNKIDAYFMGQTYHPSRIALIMDIIAEITGDQKDFSMYGVYSNVSKELAAEVFKDATYIGDYLENFFQSQGIPIPNPLTSWDKLRLKLGL